nr:ulp1 protease family, C-terminal catalytic domain-containing protein [Tanacetum cinerariifolium]
KTAVQAEKGKRTHAIVENADIRDNITTDEVDEPTDDDFMANVDYGVFMMRHMETYKGNGDCCGFSREAKEQIKEFRDLRRKYMEKILLADYNLVKNEFELEAHALTLTLK